jgi:hypothetical protein
MGFMAGPANTPSTIAVQSGFVVPCITATCTNSSGFLPVNYSMGFEYLPVFNGGTQSASFTFGATSPAIVEVFTFK